MAYLAAGNGSVIAVTNAAAVPVAVVCNTSQPLRCGSMSHAVTLTTHGLVQNLFVDPDTPLPNANMHPLSKYWQVITAFLTEEVCYNMLPMLVYCGAGIAVG